MGGSLQDQMLKLGLVNKKQAEKSKKAKHKKRKEKPKKQQSSVADENKLLAEEALAKKKERARQLNLEREEKLRKREEAGKIRQMIETSRLEKDDKGVAYRFVDNKKIFRLFVAKEMVDQLTKGQVGIVRLQDGYELCPADVIVKLREIDPQLVVHFNESRPDDGSDEDDPYAEYKVPDDLDW